MRESIGNVAQGKGGTEPGPLVVKRIYFPAGAIPTDVDYPIEFHQLFVRNAEPGKCRIRLENRNGTLSRWIPATTGLDLKVHGVRVWFDFGPFVEAWGDVNYLPPGALSLPIEVWLTTSGEPSAAMKTKATRAQTVLLGTNIVIAAADTTQLKDHVWVPYGHNRVAVQVQAGGTTLAADQIEFRWNDPLNLAGHIHDDVVTFRGGILNDMTGEILICPGDYGIFYITGGPGIALEFAWLMSYEY